jgi:hypothetical protein
MDLCVFDIFFNFLKIQMGYETMSVLTVPIF